MRPRRCNTNTFLPFIFVRISYRPVRLNNDRVLDVCLRRHVSKAAAALDHIAKLSLSQMRFPVVVGMLADFREIYQAYCLAI